MKTYKLKDGGTLAATSADAFVMTLRKSSKFDSDCTNEEYMQRFAERYKTQTGTELIFNNPDEFVNELLKFGYIEILE